VVSARRPLDAEAMSTYTHPHSGSSTFGGVRPIPTLPLAGVRLAVVLMVAALLAVVLVAAGAGGRPGPAPGTPGVVVTPRPQPAGY
jgi:hypothetical protein